MTGLRLAALRAACGLVLLGLWQVGADLRPEAVPGPLATLLAGWTDRAALLTDMRATALPALAGFLIGNALAIGLAIAFSLWLPLRRLFSATVAILYALPPITLGPLLVLAFHGMTPQIVLAGICVYYPTLHTTAFGLTEIDPRLKDVVALYGGGPVTMLLRVRLRSSLPALTAGLKIAAPAAILGAILAEFGSGAPGLGSALLAAIGRGVPAHLWAVAMAATALSAAVYGGMALLGRWMHAAAAPAPLLPGRETERRIAWGVTLAWGCAACALPLCLWQMLPWLLGVSPILLRPPSALMTYLVTGPGAAEAWSTLLPALGQSVPLAVLGMGIGLGVAFVLALLVWLWQGLGRVVMPVALVMQSMPLVVFAPVIVLLFGRGYAGTLGVAGLVSFFPAFVAILGGFERLPTPARDVLDLYGAGRIAHLRYLMVPAAIPYLCAAARLVAPSALLGVMTAEWLSTGYGLGGVLDEARGELDYGMSWSVALLAVIVSLTLVALAGLVERAIMRRFGA